MSFKSNSGHLKRKMSEIPSDEEIGTPDTSESSSTLSDYEVAATLKRQKYSSTNSPDHIYVDFSGGSLYNEASAALSTTTVKSQSKQATTPKRNVTFAAESSFKYYDAPNFLNGFPGVESTPIEEVVDAYLTACCQHKVQKCNYIIQQLMEMKRNNDYSATLNLIMPINFDSVNTLEAIFAKANFKCIYLNNSKYIRECSIIILQIIEYYKPTQELYITEREDNILYWDTFGQMIKNNDVLIKIGFCEINVRNETSYKVYTKIEENNNIKAVRFDACQLMSCPLYNIEVASITELHICYCNLVAKHASIIATHLKNNNQLNILDLSYNKLEDTGFLLISKVMHNPTTTSPAITELMMVDNNLSHKCSLSVNYLLLFCKRLKVLNLGKNNLGDTFIFEIKSSLLTNSSLEGLGLQATQLTGEALQILKDVLIQNSSILHLDVKNNYGILPEYIQEFATYVQQTSLVQMDFNSDPMNMCNFYEEVCEIHRVLTLHRHLWEVVNNKIWVPKEGLLCDTYYEPPIICEEKKKPKNRFAVTKVCESNDKFTTVTGSRFTIQTISDLQVPSTSSAATERAASPVRLVSEVLNDVIDKAVLPREGEAQPSSDEHENENSAESDTSENQNLSLSTSSWDEE